MHFLGVVGNIAIVTWTCGDSKRRFVYDFYKLVATGERPIADGGDGVAYRYARKAVAICERTITDGDWVGNCYTRKIGAIIERLIADACDFVAIYHFGDVNIGIGASANAGNCAGSSITTNSIGQSDRASSWNTTIDVSIITIRTRICSITILGCRGGSNCGSVAVTKSIHDFLCYKNFVANRTMLTLGNSYWSAGRCYRLIDNLGVPECINRLAFVIIALGTIPLKQSFFFTGGFFNNNPLAPKMLWYFLGSSFLGHCFIRKCCLCFFLGSLS